MVTSLLRSAFSFRGELDRKSYGLGFVAACIGLFAGGVVLFLIGALALVGLRWAAVIEPKMYTALSELWISLDLLAFSISSVWICAALAVKRARSFGVSAFISLPVCLLIGPLDRLVLCGLTDARFVWPFHKMTPLGGGATAILFILLFAWPSRSALRPSIPRGSRTQPT
jgi:uncharacterized membrane protein YhaH (DUF805 family)